MIIKEFAGSMENNPYLNNIHKYQKCPKQFQVTFLIEFLHVITMF